jgi:hypothetical protein
MDAAGIASHPKLSPAAKAHSKEALQAEVDTAELALGFLDVPWTEVDLPRARLAIVLQVNHQVATPELAVRREKKGDQEWEYRGGNDALPAVDATAALLAEALLERYQTEAEPDEYLVLRSLR